jgi:hypothetical protein
MKPLGNITGESLVAGRFKPIIADWDGLVMAGTFSKDTS